MTIRHLLVAGAALAALSVAACQPKNNTATSDNTAAESAAPMATSDSMAATGASSAPAADATAAASAADASAAAKK